MKKRDLTKNLANQRQRFSIRKLTIGAASVLLGTTFLFGAGQVQAAENQNGGVTTENTEQSPTNTEQDKTSTTDNEESATNDLKSGQTLSDSQVEKKDESKSSSIDNKKNDLGQNIKAPTTIDEHDAANSEDDKKVVKSEKNTLEVPQTKATANADQLKASKVKADTEKEVHTATVKYWDVVNNRPITIYNRLDGNLTPKLGTLADQKKGNGIYDPSTGVVTFKGKEGTTVKSASLTFSMSGYKLLNPEEVDSQFEVHNPNGIAGGYGTSLKMPDHDVNVTLKFAPLSDFHIHYQDENGNDIYMLTVHANAATPDSYGTLNGDNRTNQATRYTFVPIEIPGYEALPNQIAQGKTNQYQKKDDPNPVNIYFKYKTVNKQAAQDIFTAPNGDKISNQDEISEVMNLPYYANSYLDTTQTPWAPTYEKANKNNWTGGDVEYGLKYLIDKTVPRGYSYIGSVNDPKNDDLVNARSQRLEQDYIHNLPVILRYVDTKGNVIAQQEIMQSNEEFRAQAPNTDGIDHDHYLYPAGDWQAPVAKDIKGYTFKYILGQSEADSSLPTGKYLPFYQYVTYVYDKPVPDTPPTSPTQPTIPEQPTSPISNPSNPTQPTQPTSPSNPTQPAKQKTPPKTPEPSKDKSTKPNKPNNKQTKQNTPKKQNKQTRHNKGNHASDVDSHRNGADYALLANHNHGNHSSITGNMSSSVKNSVSGNHASELPQTGAESNNFGLIGALVASLGSLFSLFGVNKKRKN